MNKIFLFLIAMILVIPLANAQLNLTPIALWRFEDNSSIPTVFDSSPNDNDGILVADASFDTFVKGTNVTGNGSTLYDGADDRIDVLDADNDFVFGDGSNDQPFSTGAWINMDDATGFRITAKRASNSQIEWSLFVTAGDVINFMVADDDNSVRQGRITDTVTSLENQWIYVVGTYDGSESSGGITIYIDGVISDIANDNAGAYVAMDDSDSNMTIGVINTVSSANGHLDEAFVIGVELTEAQVNTAMNDGWGVDFTNPTINNCQVNNTALSCNDVIQFSCNVTDENIDSVFFGFNDTDGKNFVNVTTNISSIFSFNKQYTLTTSGLNETYNFINATAVDTFDNLNITLFDIPYNYSCAIDTVDPVINTPLINFTVFNQLEENFVTNSFCTDNVDLERFQITVTNASGVILNLTNISTTIDTNLTIFRSINISQFGQGDYDVDAVCIDDSNNQDDLFFVITVINFDELITLNFPVNNSIIAFFDTPSERFDIDFSCNVNAGGTCILYLNDTVETSQGANLGLNIFDLDGFDVNQTLKFNVECDFTTIKLNSSFHVFDIQITEVFQQFQASVCRTDIGSVLLLGLFFLIAFILIILGLSSGIGFIGFFGSLALLFSSIFISTCSTPIASIFIFVSILFMFFFISRGFFPSLYDKRS